jgi:hypothetical protein
MRKYMIYKLRILILETYVRITMIGYESKQKRFAERFGHMEPEVDQAGIHAMSALNTGLSSMQFFQGRS